MMSKMNDNMASDPCIGGHIYTENSRKIIHCAKLHKKNYREKTRTVLIEGTNSVEQALTAGIVQEILVHAQWVENFSDIINQATEYSLAISLVSEKAVHKLSETVNSTGIFALAHMPQRPDRTWNLWKVVAILHNVQDPGNVGNIIRTCDALGVDALVLSGHCVDPWNAKVIRSSAGSIFHQNVISQDNICELLDQLRCSGHRILATTGHTQTYLPEISDTLHQPVAWIFGNESQGLDPQIIDLADQAVAIPQQGFAESYNITTAAAICLYTSIYCAS